MLLSSAAAHEADDLDCGAFLDGSFIPGIAGNDLPVHFDSDLLGLDFQVLQEVGNRNFFNNFSRFPVYLNLHDSRLSRGVSPRQNWLTRRSVIG